MKMYIKITIFFLALLTTSSALADDNVAMGEFFQKATQYTKERDYAAFKTLYCGNPPESLGKAGYFENKNRIFSDIKLAPRQRGLFDNIQYDFILYLCSHTKNTKDICMVQPVIETNERLCIINILNKH